MEANHPRMRKGKKRTQLLPFKTEFIKYTVERDIGWKLEQKKKRFIS